MIPRVEPRHLAVPLLDVRRDAPVVLILDAVAGEPLVEDFEHGAGVAGQGGGCVLVGVHGCYVYVYEPYVRVLEGALGGGGEVGVAGSDPDHEVGLARGAVGGEVTGRSHGSEGTRVSVGHRALSGLRLRDGDARTFGEAQQLIRGLGVDRAASGHDQGAFGVADPIRRPLQKVRVRQRTPDVPHALLEELLGEVVRLGLHVLGQRERDRAGLGLIRQNPNRGERGGDQLLRPFYSVPVAAHGPEGVVYRERAVMRSFELLQDRVGAAGGEHVAGQEQHRQAVYGRQSGSGEHVGRAGADGGGAGEGGEAVVHRCVSGGGMYHSLFVAGLVVGEVIGVLLKSLADTGDVAVAEDAEGSGEQPALYAVALGVLLR